MDPAERFRQLTCTRQLRNDIAARSIRAGLATGAAGIIDFGIRIVSTAVLARLVSPEHFGLIMMTAAVIAVADQLRDLGLSAATVQQPEITHEEVSNLFWVNVLVGGIGALLLVAVSPWVGRYYHEPRLVAITCLLATTLLFGGVTVQHQALLTRQLKLGHTASVRLFSSVSSTVLAIALAWGGLGYWALLWREVARAALLAAGMWWCFPWIPGAPSRRTDIRHLLRFGVNLTSANILGTAAAGIDRFLLGRFWGAGPVALYRQAFQLISAPTEQLLSPLYQVTQPTLSMLQGDPARYTRCYLKLLTLVCLLTMPLSLYVALYADAVTAVLLGPAWMTAAPVLCILSFGAFIKQATSSSAFILITGGRSAAYFALTVAQNATLVACMLLGVRWGIYGIALAEVATSYLLIAPRLHYTLRNSPIPLMAFLAGMLRPVLASLVMSYTLLALRYFVPLRTSAANLSAGALLGSLVFVLVWLGLPGGRAETVAVFADLRAALQRKSGRLAPAQAPAAAA